MGFAMGREEIGLVIYYIFIAMSIVGVLSLMLEINMTSAQALEFIISLVIYHIIIRNKIYKTFFTAAKSDTNNGWLLPKDNPSPFIFYSIISVLVSAIIMYVFNVHLSNNVHVVLEFLAIGCYQYLLTKMIAKEPIK